jgi:hypothetical protein
MINAKKLAITIEYEMYLKLCEGELDKDWLIEEKKLMSFYEFREILSTQMMAYDPRSNKYRGDQ